MKPISAFPPSVVNRGNGRCGQCSAEASAELRALQPERVRSNFRRWYARNRSKHLARTGAIYWRNTEASFERHLRRRYGIGLAEYKAIIDEQGGGCALCGKTQATEKLRLAVDHDHRTGRVRGVLCHHCNRALGALGDTVEQLSKALDYLKRSEPCLSVVGA